jgi:hypothetical protein
LSLDVCSSHLVLNLGLGNNILDGKARLDFKFETVVRIPDIPLEKISKVHICREQGGKYRAVTSSQGDLLWHGHRDRKAAFKLLLKFKPTARPLLGRPLTFQIPMGSEPRRLYSADLSEATNLLSHEAIMETCSILHLNPDVVMSHHCFFEDKEGRIDIYPVRGTFMGLPSSWVVLSVAHAAVCLHVGHQNTFYLKGDDLIAYWTEPQWVLYQTLMQSLGFKINLKKSFIGDFRGVFCEQLLSLELKKVNGPFKFYTLEPMRHCVSLRFITKRSDYEEKLSIPWASKLRRMDAIRGDLTPNGYKAVKKAILSFVPVSYRRMVVSYRLPLELGGLHIRDPYVRDKILKGREIHAYYAVHNGTLRPLTGNSFRYSTPAGIHARKEYEDLLKIPLRHYLSEGRKIVLPDYIETLISMAAEKAVLQGYSLIPKLSQLRPLQDLKRFSNHCRVSFGEGRITIDDSYLLCSKLGVDVTDRPPNRPYGWNRLSNSEVMVKPSSTPLVL